MKKSRSNALWFGFDYFQITLLYLPVQLLYSSAGFCQSFHSLIYRSFVQRYYSVLAGEFTGKLSNSPLSRCYILSLRLRDPSFINNQMLNALIEINDWLVWMEIDCVTRLCRVPSSPISSSESRDLINLYFQLNKLKIFIDKTMICYPWYFNYLIPSHRHVAEIGLEAEKCIP